MFRWCVFFCLILYICEWSRCNRSMSYRMSNLFLTIMLPWQVHLLCKIGNSQIENGLFFTILGASICVVLTEALCHFVSLQQLRHVTVSSSQEMVSARRRVSSPLVMDKIDSEAGILRQKVNRSQPHCAVTVFVSLWRPARVSPARVSERWLKLPRVPRVRPPESVPAGWHAQRHSAVKVKTLRPFNTISICQHNLSSSQRCHGNAACVAMAGPPILPILGGWKRERERERETE